MTLPAVLRRRAVDDLNGIYDWYENERQGLGPEFLDDFKHIAMSIQEFPQSFARVNDKVRRAKLKQFPYNVFYQVESKRIVVLAVIHAARDPHVWPLPRKRSR